MGIGDEMSEFFNKLTPAELERLALLGEELGEVQQAIGKIIRHGYDEHAPGIFNTNNRLDLTRELGDLMAAIEIMIDIGDIKNSELSLYTDAKLRKVFKFMHHNSERQS